MSVPAAVGWLVVPSIVCFAEKEKAVAEEALGVGWTYLLSGRCCPCSWRGRPPPLGTRQTAACAVGDGGGTGKGRARDRRGRRCRFGGSGCFAPPISACTYPIKRSHVYTDAPEFLRLVVLVQDVVHLAAVLLQPQSKYTSNQATLSCARGVGGYSREK